jgi:hypothetical protein
MEVGGRMTDLIPTSHLRFVERTETISFDPVNNSSIGRKIRVLQQWHASGCDIYVPGNPGGSAGEWRDVPLTEGTDAK